VDNSDPITELVQILDPHCKLIVDNLDPITELVRISDPHCKLIVDNSDLVMLCPLFQMAKEIYRLCSAK
jgi:hypothetical protein